MSIYEQIGGRDAVSAVVDLFYHRVLADPLLSGYFVGTDMGSLKSHQRAFITAALGGTRSYAGRSMTAAHAGRDIDKTAFDAVIGHLAASLVELGVPEEVIGQIGAKLAPLEAVIVTVSAPAV